jgi:hypothetical protein
VREATKIVWCKSLFLGNLVVFDSGKQFLSSLIGGKAILNEVSKRMYEEPCLELTGRPSQTL